jgi:hypothetical protein
MEYQVMDDYGQGIEKLREIDICELYVKSYIKILLGRMVKTTKPN